MTGIPPSGHRLLIRLRTRGLALLLAGLGAVAAYLLAWALYWPATGPATGIQQPLYYNESYTWPMAWTLHQAAPGVPPPAPLTLREGDTVRQEVHAAAGHLAALRVWLAGERGGEWVQATLFDPQSGMAYAGRFGLDEEAKGRYYRLHFPPIVDAGRRQFTLHLQAVEGTVLARVGYVDRLPGRLRLNEFPTPGDLDLTAYHRGPPGLWTVRVIGQRLLPELLRTRLRQYKPAFFKGATFEVLLTGVAIAVVLLLWALAVPVPRGRAPWAAVALPGIGLLLAGTIVFNWDIRGMLGLCRAVELTLEPRATQPPVLPVFQPSSPPASVRDLVARLAFVEREPEPRQVQAELIELGGRRRACIAVPARSQVTYGLRVPHDGALHLGIALPIGASQETLFQVRVEGHILLDRTLSPASIGTWHDVALDLRPYAGRLAYLSLSTRPADVPPGFDEPEDRPPAAGPLPVTGLWAAPHVVSDRSWLLPYPPAELPQREQVVRFGGQAGPTPEIELLGYDAEWLDPSTGSHPHGALRLTLYWRALSSVDRPYTVFVHVLGAGDEMQGQWDSEPLGGAYPTDVWPLDVIVRDVYTIPVVQERPPDGYQVAVGLYEWATMERLAAYDDTGTPWPDGRVLLKLER